MDKIRCFGGNPGQELYAHYHDYEWGVPVYDDQKLFEMLILEGAQAGLSWETILKKRENYRKVFYNFKAEKVANIKDAELELALNNIGIVRNRLKVFSTRKNAKVFLEIQKAYGSFSKYLWAFVGNKPIVHHWDSFADMPAETEESKAISKDLKKRGMTFVGSKIIYAYMQAVGLVNDHLTSCWMSKKR